jgi:serine O-acetyltransferase
MSDDEGVRAHTNGCLRSFAELKRYLAADLYRYSGNTSARSFVKNFVFTPGFKCTVWIRLCGYLKVAPYGLKLLYPLVKYMLLRCRYKYGITIPEYTVIGPGLFINRFGGIYFHGDVVLGRNVNVTHGVVLGYSNRGRNQGAPVIGDEVFLASGAKVIGGVKVGNRVCVGVNSVVTRDVEDNAVVVGLPAKPVSYAGSEGYINRIHPGNK